MPTVCSTFAQLHRVRVTLLDSCGRPVEGPASTVVSEGIVTVNAETEKEDGDELLQKNGAGKLCVNKRSDDQFKRANITITFCEVDPALFSLVTGMPLEVDYEGDAVGYAWEENNDASHFALEAWVGVGDEDCAAGDLPYGYLLFPHLTNGYASGMELGNTAITFELTAWSKRGNGWGVGPYDVLNDGESPGVPAPLPSATGDKHFRQFLTTLAPPDATCGATALVIES